MSVRAALIGMVVVVLAALAPHGPAVAEDDRATMREAAKHFQRGVTLYGEADYRGALVEFNRAYALAPNRTVLYNIGETNYQLRDYAAALTIFERYLSDAGPTDSHRAELEGNVKELRARVGQLTIMTVPVGAEIAVDDRVVGKTPLERPVVVSIGHLKVTASVPGRAPITRYVDVAAEDNVSVSLEIPGATVPRLMGQPTAGADDAALGISGGLGNGTSDNLAASPRTGSSWRTVGWISTGVLAVGAAGFGLLALRESRDLATARDAFPTKSTTLQHLSDVTTTYSVIADSLAVGALVVGGITLYSTLGARAEARLSSTHVTVGLGSMSLEGTF